MNSVRVQCKKSTRFSPDCCGGHFNRFDSWNTLNSSVASAAKRVALTFLLAGSVRGSAGTVLARAGSELQ
jgi:hypothetical protein